jgi:hypothetical protein
LVLRAAEQRHFSDRSASPHASIDHVADGDLSLVAAATFTRWAERRRNTLSRRGGALQSNGSTLPSRKACHCRRRIATACIGSSLRRLAVAPVSNVTPLGGRKQTEREFFLIVVSEV